MITGVKPFHMVIVSIMALGMNVWYFNDSSQLLGIFTFVINLATAAVFACATWDEYQKGPFNR